MCRLITRRWVRRPVGESAFTLVELMIVVGIIGVLVALAIPQYQRFQGKSRQSEARMALAGIYTVEHAYAGDSTSFGACLTQMGYLPDSPARFYSVGFTDAQAGEDDCGAAGNVDCASLPGAACNVADFDHRIMATQVAGTATVQADDSELGGVLSRTAFTVTARGNIQAGGNIFDVWTIDQAKTLTNTNNGL